MKKFCVLGALAACVQPALAVDIKAGDWTVSVGGIVNAYATVVDCSGGQVGGLALGGAALGPRFIEWNFVATRQDRIEQAKADWRESIAKGFANTRFSQARGEHEYIPLPGDSEDGQPPRPSKDCPTT